MCKFGSTWTILIFNICALEKSENVNNIFCQNSFLIDIIRVNGSSQQGSFVVNTFAESWQWWVNWEIMTDYILWITPFDAKGCSHWRRACFEKNLSWQWSGRHTQKFNKENYVRIWQCNCGIVQSQLIRQHQDVIMELPCSNN